MHKKYPRTYHLPWSLGKSDDDKTLHSTNIFTGKEIIVSEKMDGENTTLYKDYMHARSLDSNHNYTRDWVKKLQTILGHDIPDGWRLCGENVNYKHSIEYNNLESYFYLLSIWDENNICLSYEDTTEWASMMDLIMPKVFYKGEYNEKLLIEMANDIDTNIIEGYVIRLTDSFKFEDFSTSVSKFVRKNHVQTDIHWLKNTTPNKLGNNIKPAYMAGNTNNKTKIKR